MRRMILVLPVSYSALRVHLKIEVRMISINESKKHGSRTLLHHNVKGMKRKKHNH
jgi:hypothetical protein